MAQAVEEWYKQMPVITRFYLTAAVVTTIGCSLDESFWQIISPYNLYVHPRLVFKQYQFWRLITNFFFSRNRSNYPIYFILYRYFFDSSYRLHDISIYPKLTPLLLIYHPSVVGPMEVDVALTWH
ncbi:hypothetical protein MLD38_019401 [Melastoma candidum]|uniref:Uncharacterized protein n=1 Tax=Melastoma candidum TaxID=119954 RepID=A0ACB9QXH0_9MYRT|nr:hypothetical protein MLD38_019401 [Melastoma candidum]